MKKTFLGLWICCMCFNFSSCDEDDVIGLLPSFKVDVNKTAYINVPVDQTNGDWVTFSEETSLNIVNEDTEDYLNKIKNVEITKLSYKIINFIGDPAGQVEGAFSVANQVSLENSFVVKEAADNQTVYQITEVNELNRIANALKSGQTVTVKYSGSALCDDDSMNFDIEVTLVAKITIDP